MGTARHGLTRAGHACPSCRTLGIMLPVWRGKQNLNRTRASDAQRGGGMDRMKDLVAIVTGASRGLGRAIAREYGREGAKIVVCARPQSPTGLPGTIHDTAQCILDAGGEAFAIDCDVSDDSQVQSMVRQVMDRYGWIDVLVNNAGMMILGESFLGTEPARWDDLMSVNVRGPYLTCRHILPIMMEQRRGNIINIGSRMGSDHTTGGGILYSTSKAAVHMFSLCLAEEVREYNIAVNILSPGAMKSEGSSAIPWAQNYWHERVDPEVVGPCAVYLALQDAQSFTGRLALRSEFGKTWGF